MKPDLAQLCALLAATTLNQPGSSEIRFMFWNRNFQANLQFQLMNAIIAFKWPSVSITRDESDCSFIALKLYTIDNTRMCFHLKAGCARVCSITQHVTDERTVVNVTVYTKSKGGNTRLVWRNRKLRTTWPIAAITFFCFYLRPG